MRKRKLGRTTAHRRALFGSLVTAVMLHDRIETTESKAKSGQALCGPDGNLGETRGSGGPQAGRCFPEEAGSSPAALCRCGPSLCRSPRGLLPGGENWFSPGRWGAHGHFRACLGKKWKGVAKW